MQPSYIQRAAGFFGLLSGLNKTYLDVCCKALDDLRLSRAEVAILLSLQADPQCDTANGLCGRLGFSKGRISQALVALEEKGLLQASVSPQDRRRHPIALLPAAGPAMERLERASQYFIGHILGDIPPRGAGYRPPGRPNHPSKHSAAAAKAGPSSPAAQYEVNYGTTG